MLKLWFYICSSFVNHFPQSTEGLSDDIGKLYLSFGKKHITVEFINRDRKSYKSSLLSIITLVCNIMGQPQ